MSNYGNVGYRHGIEVLNGILFTFENKFNIRARSCTVAINLISIQHNIIA